MTKRARDENTKRTSKVTFHFNEAKRCLSLMNICPVRIQTMFCQVVGAHWNTRRANGREWDRTNTRVYISIAIGTVSKTKLHIINFGIIARSCTDWLNARVACAQHTKQHERTYRHSTGFLHGQKLMRQIIDEPVNDSNLDIIVE